MIISHKYKFIFFAIPKTATHAIRNALRPHLDENDWEQVELFQHSRLPFKEFEKINHGHITALETKQVVGKEIWDSYYKFAFVRNPFDRFISYAFFRNRKSSLFANNKLAMMKLIFKNPYTKKDILFHHQIDFVTDEHGEVMIDFIGKYENLQPDFNLICQKLGLPETKLKNVNTTNRNPYTEYYDKGLEDQVKTLYAKDFKKFGY